MAKVQVGKHKVRIKLPLLVSREIIIVSVAYFFEIQSLTYKHKINQVVKAMWLIFELHA